MTLVTAVVNIANQTLTINSISATGPFTVTPTGSHNLPPQGSLDLTVTYLAEALGTQTGLLTVAHNGPGGVLECPLIGTSVTSSLQFVTGQQADFGDVPLNITDSVSVVVRAQGNIPTSITNLVLMPPFSILEALPIVLNPTQALILRPRFTPTVLGDANGIMVIHHTAPSSPDTVYLHGVGIPNQDADDDVGVPTAYRLAQNYPNPFNPATTIAFDLPKASQVKLDVYDINGRLVQELMHQELPAGRHAAPFDGAALPSGLYLYRLTTPEFSDLGKMMLLK